VKQGPANGRSDGDGWLLRPLTGCRQPNDMSSPEAMRAVALAVVRRPSEWADPPSRKAYFYPFDPLCPYSRNLLDFIYYLQK